ncbi:MAG: hypothetical protein JNL98_03605 [Bryobacterales bacterium]|nr:hypothetical protein [Bryobacterales bacterium]
MQPFLIPAMGALMLMAICSVALMHRGSSLHLRWCLFSFCLMALTQGVMIVAAAFGAAPAFLSTMQLILAGLSLQAMYQVSAELVSRGRAERRLNLAVIPHDPPCPARDTTSVASVLLAPVVESAKGPRPIEHSALVNDAVSVEDLEKSTLRATADLLLLLGALTASSDQTSPGVTVKKYLAASRTK